MADLKVKISEFPLATEAKDSDDIAILQDGVNKRIKTPKIEEKILKKVEERYVNKNQLGVSNGVATLGSDGKLSESQRFAVDINPSFIPIDLTTPPSEVDGVFLPTTSGVYENYGGLSIDLDFGSYLITKIGDTYKSILLAVESTLIANDIEDLRSKEPAYDGQIITLLGYYEAGDKEPLNYKWTSEQGIDDGGSVINTESGSWYAVFSDVINVADFGVKGDGLSDEQIMFQNACNYCDLKALKTTNTSDITLFVPANFIIDIKNTVFIPNGINVDIKGRINYSGVKDKTAVVIGKQGEYNRGANIYFNVTSFPRDSDWSDPDFVGVILYNSTQCVITPSLVDGFYKGVVCMGDVYGFAYNQMHIKIINSNKIGIYLDFQNGGWCNENKFYGGRFATTSDLNPGESRLGVRITGDNNVFYAPSFELNWLLSRPGISQAAVFDDAFDCKIIHCRNEGNSALNLSTPGVAFEINGSSRANSIEVGYTYDRHRSRLANAFRDNSDSKQNTYKSVDNLFADSQNGNIVYESGNLAANFVSSTDEIGYIHNVSFISTAGIITPFTPAGFSARHIGGLGDIDRVVSVHRSGFCVRIDTKFAKKFSVLRSGLSGQMGQIGLKFYDENQVEIVADETLSLIDEQVENTIPNETFSYNSSYGGCYLTASPAPANLPVYFSVKEIVKYVVLFIGAPLNYTSLKSFSIKCHDDMGKDVSVTPAYPSQKEHRKLVTQIPVYGTVTTGELLYVDRPESTEPFMIYIRSLGTFKPINITADYIGNREFNNVSDISQIAVGDIISVSGFSASYLEVVSVSSNGFLVNSSTGTTIGTNLTVTNKMPDYDEYLKKPASIGLISLDDATDLETALLLVNELKSKLNTKLTSDGNVGI